MFGDAKMRKMFRVASGLLHAGKYAAAEVLLRKWNEKDPDALPIMDFLSHALFRQGKIDEAISILLRSLEIDPQQFETYLRLSQCYFQNDRMDLALAAAESAEKWQPNYTKVLCIKAYVLMHMKRFDEALITLNKALNVKKSNGLVYSYLGLVYFELKDYDQAMATAKTAITFKRTDECANTVLTLCHFFSEQPEAAKPYLAELSKSSEYLNYLAFRLFEARYVEDAFPISESIYIDRGLDRGEGSLYAVMLVRRGRIDEAGLIYEAILAQPVKKEADHFNRGVALAGLQRFEEAVECYRLYEGKELSAEFSAAIANNFGNAWFNLDDFERAEAEFRRSIDLEPTLANPWIGLAECHLEAGNLAEAEAALRRSVELCPRMTEGFLGLSNYFERRGDVEAAIEQVRRALELEPSHAKSKATLARLLERT